MLNQAIAASETKLLSENRDKGDFSLEAEVFRANYWVAVSELRLSQDLEFLGFRIWSF